MNKKTSILSNYFYTMCYQVLALLTPLITTPYVARVLGVDGVGQYSYAFSIVNYFSILGALGVNTYGKLKIAEARDDIKETSKLFWEIFIARCITVAISLCLYGILYIKMVDYRPILLVLSLNILSVAFDITWFFQGLEEFRLTALRSIIVKILNVIAIFLFVKDSDDVLVYTFIMQFTLFIGFTVLWGSLKKNIVKINFREIKLIYHWKRSAVYFVPTLAGTLYSYVDKTMIGAILGSDSENGYYEEAHKIEQVLLSAVTSLSMVIMPRMAFLFKKAKRSEANGIIKRSVTVTLMISFAMMTGLICVSERMVPWFLGKGFENSIKMLYVFSPLLMVSGLKACIGQGIVMPLGKQKEYNTAVVIGTIFNIITNYVLITLYGGIGAAIASLLSEIVVVFILLLYSKSYLSILDIIRWSYKYVVASVVMAGVVIAVDNILDIPTTLLLMTEALVGACVYFAVLMLMRDTVAIDMKNRLLSLLRRKKK